MTSQKKSIGNPRNSEVHSPPKWASKCGLLSLCTRRTGKHGERPRKVLGSDKWVPRKLLGKVTKVTKVTKVIKCMIDYKIDHLASWE